MSFERVARSIDDLARFHLPGKAADRFFEGFRKRNPSTCGHDITESARSREPKTRLSLTFSSGIEFALSRKFVIANTAECAILRDRSCAIA